MNSVTKTTKNAAQTVVRTRSSVTKKTKSEVSKEGDLQTKTKIIATKANYKVS